MRNPEQNQQDKNRLEDRVTRLERTQVRADSQTSTGLTITNPSDVIDISQFLTEDQILSLINGVLNTALEALERTDEFTSVVEGSPLELSGSSYEETSIQITSTGTGTATIIIQGSNNGTTYFPIETFVIVDAIDEPFAYRTNYKFVRTECTAYASTGGPHTITTVMRSSV